MRSTVKKPTPPLARRCRVSAVIVFVILFSVSVGLWRTSTIFLNYWLQEVWRAGSKQAIQRLESFLEDRLLALRYIGHMCARTDLLTQAEFQSFCSMLIADVPGIRGVILTDLKGFPSWTAPGGFLS